MNDDIKYGRSPLEVAHFILFCLGLVFGGMGIVLVSAGWFLLGFALVLIALAFYWVNERFGD